MNLWQKIGKWAAEQAFLWGYKKIVQRKTDDLTSDVRAIVTPAARIAAKNASLKSKDSSSTAMSAAKRRR